MLNIVQFAVGGVDRPVIADVAQQIIDALGLLQACRVGQLACARSLGPIEQRHLLAIAEEIAARQGYSWYFAENEAADEASISGSARCAMVAKR